MCFVIILTVGAPTLLNASSRSKFGYTATTGRTANYDLNCHTEMLPMLSYRDLTVMATPKQIIIVMMTPAQCHELCGQFEQQSLVSSSSRSGAAGTSPSLDALT